MTLCSKQVNRGDSRATFYQPCGREALDGDTLCKLHRRVEDKRAEKDAERKAEWDAGDRLQREAVKLSGILGVKVDANYSIFGSTYDGRFILPGDYVRELAERTT